MEQKTADHLIDLKKRIIDPYITFPSSNNKLTLNVESTDGSESFLLDINRAGSIKISRCTFQERYSVTIALIRLDLDESKPHQNPDGTVIKGPHIHIYKEGYGDRWAYLLREMSPCPFSNTSNLLTAFIEFCSYCNINSIPEIQGSL